MRDKKRRRHDQSKQRSGKYRKTRRSDKGGVDDDKDDDDVQNGIRQLRSGLLFQESSEKDDAADRKGVDDDAEAIVPTDEQTFTQNEIRDEGIDGHKGDGDDIAERH